MTQKETQSDLYCRTPLPPDVLPSVWISALLWGVVIFSPFISFTIYGVVSDAALPLALWIASGVLLVLALLKAKKYLAYRKLPEALRAEYREGRLFPAMGFVSASYGSGDPTLTVHPDKKKQTAIALSGDGVSFSHSLLRGTSWNLAKTYALMRMSAAAANGGNGRDDSEDCFFIPWKDMREWQVHEDMDTDPPYYRVVIGEKSYIRINRPDSVGDNVAALDFVRSVGRVPVRIFCDIR